MIVEAKLLGESLHVEYDNDNYIRLPMDRDSIIFLRDKLNGIIDNETLMKQLVEFKPLYLYFIIRDKFTGKIIKRRAYKAFLYYKDFININELVFIGRYYNRNSKYETLQKYSYGDQKIIGYHDYIHSKDNSFTMGLCTEKQYIDEFGEYANFEPITVNKMNFEKVLKENLHYLSKNPCYDKIIVLAYRRLKNSDPFDIMKIEVPDMSTEDVKYKTVKINDQSIIKNTKYYIRILPGSKEAKKYIKDNCLENKIIYSISVDSGTKANEEISKFFNQFKRPRKHITEADRRRWVETRKENICKRKEMRENMKR